jgi:AP-3 complex subunit delta-1
MGDETLGPAADDSSREDIVQPRPSKAKKSLLDVDSSGLASLSLVDDDGISNRKLTQFEIERKEQEEAEMKKALQEVERLRLEMQRASERLHVKEEVAIKKKKKKVRKVDVEGDGPAATPPVAPEGEDASAAPAKKKKKKVKPEGEANMGEAAVEDGQVKKKKKKRRNVVLDDGEAPAE